MTYNHLAKRFISPCEMIPFAFAWVSASSRPKRNGREIDGGFEARPSHRRRATEAFRSIAGNDSEMAPQTIGIAQDGLGMAIRWVAVESKEKR